MPSALYDLKYLEAGLEALEAYLLSDGLYWQIGASAPAGEAQFPSLTLGGLLLARQRLAARRLEPAQQQAFDGLVRTLDLTRSHWRTAWANKARRSFQARLTQWNNYLGDYSTQPDTYAHQYPQEVRVRLMLALLQSEAEQIEPASLELLDSLDALLHAQLQPDAFVWEAELAAGFPQAQYWYLYGRLAE